MEKVGCGIKLVVLPLVLITVCCVATALYVTFTEVGATTVKGCQGRYLWPVMIPLFLTAGQIRVLTIPRSKIINRWIETVVMLVSIILAGCMMTEFL
ncbi:MAG: DUF2142 domain-containing protein [Lachnospiraceae bacterium]|nr:DUF2142 domain-containing protein [Lachnospiraceae bacterium]